jgi:DNA-binding beta-propeller fold protein YncE
MKKVERNKTPWWQNIGLLALGVGILFGTAANTQAATIWAEQGQDIVRLNYDETTDTVTEEYRFTAPTTTVGLGTFDITDQYTGLAYSPERDSLFVVDGSGSNGIVEFDPNDGSVLNSFGSPTGSYSVPGLAFVNGRFFGQLYSPSIIEIDPDTGAAIGGYISLDVQCLDGATGRLFGRSGNSILEIDPIDFSVISTLSAPYSNIGGLAFNGQYLFGAYGDTILRIDPETGNLLGSADLGSGLVIGGLAAYSAAVPEPASILFIGSGLAGLFGLRKRV